MCVLIVHWMKKNEENFGKQTLWGLKNESDIRSQKKRLEFLNFWLFQNLYPQKYQNEF